MRSPSSRISALRVAVLVLLAAATVGCDESTRPTEPKPASVLAETIIPIDPVPSEPVLIDRPISFFPPPIPFSSVSAGRFHTCGLDAGSVAYCWGRNESGQLGDNSTTGRQSPVPVAGGLVFRQVSSGHTHTCGVTTTSIAYCWGSNISGQLGDGSTTDHLSPTPVAGGLAFRHVSAGYNHSCGVTTTSAVYCWGNNATGGLGDGTTIARLAPVQATGGLAIRLVTAGNGYSCGVATPTNLAYCWGSNPQGQLGDGTTTNRLVPTAVSGGLQFRGLSAGQGHSCGTGMGSNAYCWGDNYHGQLGDGTTIDRLTPVVVSGSFSFLDVDAGIYHSCAVNSTNVAYCWGNNSSGQLGDGTVTTNRLTPVQVAGSLTARVPSAGGFHSCVPTVGGGAYCWGYDYYGQLGNGTLLGSSATPTAVR
ncbi:MAG TPA: hypothetical protein VKA84_06355 [Gemmatimonadaceae bacterium]|nr:hypothetical protein [Gemmatimonadaceae bacterium]